MSVWSGSGYLKYSMLWRDCEGIFVCLPQNSKYSEKCRQNNIY